MKWDAEQYDSLKAPQLDAGRELVGLAGVRPDDCALDIGCGTGKLTAELAGLLGAGSVLGIDPSEEMLNRARGIRSASASWMRLSAEEMDFDGRFDLAFSNSALQWVKDQPRALSNTFRALKPGGRIAFQMPAQEFCPAFFASVDHAVASLGYERFFYRWRMPWTFYTAEAYEDLLRDAGFSGCRVFVRQYLLRFPGIDSVLAWWSSAGLRPYLAALPEGAQGYFKEAFAEGFEQYRTAGAIEFSFDRIFALAGKD